MNEENWKQQLADRAIDIIGQFGPEQPGAEWQRDFLFRLIVGEFGTVTTRVGPHSASSLMFDLRDSRTARGRVLEAVAEQFPDEAHFLAQYGRFLYDEDANYSEARTLLKKAIELAPNDASLFHMMGQSYRREHYDSIRMSSPAERTPELVSDLKKMMEQADYYFVKSRRLKPTSEYAYVSHVEFLMQAIDDALRTYPDGTPPQQVIQTNQDVRRWFNRAHGILMEADNFFARPWPKRRFAEEARHLGDLPSYIEQRRGDISKVIQTCQNLIDVSRQKGNQILPDIQFLLAYSLYTRGSSPERDERKALADFERACATLEDLIGEHPGEAGLRLWFRCARRLPQSNRILADRLETLYSLTESLEAAFYLMCIYFIRGLEEGSIVAFREFRKYKEISSKLAESTLAGRLYFREWLGPDNKLISAGMVRRDEYTREYNVSHLPRVEGRIEVVDPPKYGRLSVQKYKQQNIYGQQNIFFHPWRRDQKFYKSNKGDRVTFVVVFTYEQAVAYDVRPAK